MGSCAGIVTQASPFSAGCVSADEHTDIRHCPIGFGHDAGELLPFVHHLRPDPQLDWASASAA